jgi:hypothetical protein
MVPRDYVEALPPVRIDVTIDVVSVSSLQTHLASPAAVIL